MNQEIVKMVKIFYISFFFISAVSLPAIPESAEVACINVSWTPDLRQQLEDAISLEGKVLAHAPVQITEVIEKPGSLLVQWGEEVSSCNCNFQRVHKLPLIRHNSYS